MRARFFILLGVVAFLTAATQGLSQYPRGGPSGYSGKTSYYSDPNGFFDQMAKGKSVWLRAETTDPYALSRFDRIAEYLHITNGQITREQVVAYVQQRMAEKSSGGYSGYSRSSGPGAPPGMVPSSPSDKGASPGPSQPDMVNQWAEGMFRRYDANGDGLLNYDEMPDTLRAEREQWDKNKDGFIDLSEFKEYFKARVQQRMAERGSSGFGPMTPPEWGLPNGPPPIEEEERRPVVYRAGKLPTQLPAWFQQLDTDNDGQIGLYEWKESGRSLEEFQEIDRNNDGFLTVEEVLRHEAHKKTTAVARAGNGPALSGGSGGPGTFTGGNRGGPPSFSRDRGGPPSSGGSSGERPSSGGRRGRGGSSSRGGSSGQ